MSPQLADLDEYVQNFRARVLQDAVNEATASYWTRRAETFEAARHRPGIDYPGQATLDELRTRWCAVTELAEACRHRASVSLLQDDDDLEPIVLDVLREVA